MVNLNRLAQFNVLFMLGACTGMLHLPKSKQDLETTATFSLLTMSDYDTPYAEWSVVATDENFMAHECLVERTSQVSEEVTETGIWETCSSPYDLREAPGIDVHEGFNGQVTVRAVSMIGDAGTSITKKFRRAFWSYGLSGQTNVLVRNGSSLIGGGEFLGIRNASSQSAGRMARLNADGSGDLSTRAFIDGFDGDVTTVAVQNDGRILVGGWFSSFRGDSSVPNCLIRLLPDGTIDSGFSGITSGFDFPVNSIVVQDDGRILVGGSFVSYNGVGAAPDYLLRLNPDGTVDSTFSGITTGFDGQVLALAIQDDGKILVGGMFTSYNGSGAAPDRLIRLNANGTVDGSFSGITTGFNSDVTSIAIQGDGGIVVGGQFTSYNGSGAAPDSLIRLSTTGAVDVGFSGITTGFNSGVLSLAIQDDGKILVGGYFTAYNGNFSVPDRLIRLLIDGSVDTSFSGLTSGLDGAVRTIATQAEGKILIGGDFVSFNGGSSAPDYLLMLDFDGSIDSSFSGLVSGFSNQVFTIAEQANGKILVGGAFTFYNDSVSELGYFFGARTEAIVDTKFSGVTTGFDGYVLSAATQSDGKILVGGSFTSYNGNNAAPDRLIRLNSDGAMDLSFSGITSGFDNNVYSISMQPDGKILVGGWFASYNGNGAAPDGLIRLNTDGSVDASFSAITSGFNSWVKDIAIQDDGKILVGGNFTSYNGSGAAPDRLIRLNSDGSVDGSFSGIVSGFNGEVDSVLIQSDGKILVGGFFTSFNGSAAAPDRLIRLNSDGSVDASFSGIVSGFNASVLDVAITEDGKILAGGSFTSYNGEVSSPDGLIRLNIDGSVDTGFSGIVSGFDSSVMSLVIQDDGRILAGGIFTSYNGNASAPDRIIRLNPNGTIDHSFMGQQH